MSSTAATATITFHDISGFDAEIVTAKATEISDWAADIEAMGHTIDFATDWITSNTAGLFTRGAVKRLISIARR